MSCFQDKKIFVVDDTESILMLFTALLEAHGAEVITASSGEDFLARVEQEAPELVLMDIQMPGLDGFATLAQFKTMSLANTVPVIALTAHAMTGDKEHILDEGFTGYVAKPVDTRAFPSQVEAFLNP